MLKTLFMFQKIALKNGPLYKLPCWLIEDLLKVEKSKNSNQLEKFSVVRKLINLNKNYFISLSDNQNSKSFV